jgi:hypothetical protein
MARADELIGDGSAVPAPSYPSRDEVLAAIRA